MAQAQQPVEEEPFTRIDVSKAKELIDSGSVQLIDVREPHEWAAGHLANARHIPLGTLLNNASEYLTEDNIVFYCAAGVRSAVAAEMAAAIGREGLYNMEGGIVEWEKAGYPVER